LSVTQAAKALNVSRQALNNLVNKKSGISPEMAVRLSKVFKWQPRILDAPAIELRSGTNRASDCQDRCKSDGKKRRKVAGTTRSAA